MKLLHCLECGDVLALLSQPRSCRCGRSQGRYLEDGHAAEYSGPACVVYLSNSGVERAIRALRARPGLAPQKVACAVAFATERTRRIDA